MALLTMLLASLLGAPVILFLLGLVLARRNKSYPSWKDIDAATLKVGGTKKRLEAANEAGVDYVVVGSGLGALTSASMLAKAGYKVVVLEQHDVAGGSTHTFEDGGFEFDVGIHYIGGMLDRWFSPLRRMWSSVSDGQLEWTAADPVFDVAVNCTTGERVEMHKDPAVRNRAILEAFKDDPDAAKALKRYNRMTTVGTLACVPMFAFKLLPPFFLALLWAPFAPIWRRFGGKSVADALRDDCGIPVSSSSSPSSSSSRLKDLGGVLTYLYGDYGTNPARAPWFLHALVATHYDGGAFFPTGGSSSIAKTLVASIVRRGGHVFVRSPVSDILVDDKGRAVGVRAARAGVEVRARYGVISNAGFRNTFGCSDRLSSPGGACGAATVKRGALLPEAVAAKQRRMLQQGPLGAVGGPPANPNEAAVDAVGGSIAMVYLFVGLDASDDELGIKARNIWALKDWDHDGAFAAWDTLPDFPDAKTGALLPGLKDLPAVFVGSASAKDGDWPRRNPGKSAMTVLCPVKASWFQEWAEGTKVKHRGDTYAAVKAAWRDLLLEALYTHWPQTKGHVAYTDVATPLSNDFYLASVNGEVYGLDHTVERFSSRSAMRALHPETTVPGLYIVGQDSVNVGVASALLSGVFTATRVSYWAFLVTLVECLVS